MTHPLAPPISYGPLTSLSRLHPPSLEGPLGVLGQPKIYKSSDTGTLPGGTVGFRAGSAFIASTSSTYVQISVPVGVIAADVGLISCVIGSGAWTNQVDPQCTNQQASFTQLIGKSALGTAQQALLMVTGVVGGDVITLNTDSANTWSVATAFYFGVQAAGYTASTIATRGSSSATTVSTSVADTSGELIVTVFAEQNSPQNQTLTPSTGSLDYFRPGAGSPAGVDTSSGFVSYIEAGGSGTAAAVTATYTDASANGSAIQIALKPASATISEVTLSSVGPVMERAAETSTSVQLPDIVNAKDYLVMFCAINSIVAVTLPSGWTPLAAFSNTGNTVVPGIFVCGKYANGTEGGTTVPVTHPNVASLWQVVAFSNVDQANALDVPVVTADITTTSAGIPLSATTLSSGDALVYMAALNSTVATSLPPAGFIETADRNTGARSGTVAYKLHQPAGATGTLQNTWSLGARGDGVLLALRPQQVAVTSKQGWGILL